MWVCGCLWTTQIPAIFHSPVLVHLLVPPQVGVFPPHVSSEAIPPVHPASSLQPVCGSWVCVCVACMQGCGRWGWVYVYECVCMCVCVCVNLEENAQTPKSVCEV